MASSAIRFNRCGEFSGQFPAEDLFVCTRVLGVFLVAASFAACTPAPSGSDAGSDGGAPMTAAQTDAGFSLAEICARSAEAHFARLVRCGELTSELAELYKPVFIEQCPASIPPGVTHGRIEFDTAAVTTCLEQARNTSCLQEPPNCAVLRGTVEGGGSCFENDDCVSGFSCDTSSSCPGTCIPRVPIGLSPGPGQECVTTAYRLGGVCTQLLGLNESCAGGLTCAEPNVCSSQNVCAPPPRSRDLNESCSAGEPCGTGLQCANDVCVALVAENGTCSATLRCRDGLRCSSTNVCVVVHYGAAGATCADEGDACKPGFFCEGGTCSALRSIGGACTDFGSECSPELYCGANTCKAPGALNAPCDASLQCAEALYCSNGACTAKKPAAASCMSDDECLGFCQGLRCTTPICRER